MKFLPVFAILFAVALAPVARGDTTAALDAKLTSPPLAGFPLIFDLTITNTSPAGDKPPSFMYFGGDGVYPSAIGFEVRITDRAGHVIHRGLQNAQYHMGSRGGPHPIDQSLTFPAVADGLATGDYTLFIFTAGGSVGLPPMRSPALKVTIRDDAAAFKRAAQPYSAAPASVPAKTFTDFVGITYGFSPIVNQWLADLAKPEADAATLRMAAIRLSSVVRLPAGSESILKEAVARLQNKPPADMTAGDQAQTIQSLIRCAAHIGTDAGTEIVLSVAQGDTPQRSYAVSALGGCPGQRIDDLLVALSKDPDANVARNAQIALGARGNPIALSFAKEALKTPYTTASPTGRGPSGPTTMAITAATMILLGLSDNPEAQKIIKEVSADPQSPLRSNGALQLLTRLQLLEQGPATRP